jgi:hypothetical protein
VAAVVILENPEDTQDMVVLAVEELALLVMAEIKAVQVELGLCLGTVVAQVPSTVELVEVQ